MPKLIVIGAGPGGYEAAIRYAQHGGSVTLFEGSEVGGTCLNRGCIPTKALLHAGEQMRALTHMATWGIQAQQTGMNAQQLYLNKDNIVQKLRSGVETLLKSHRVTLIKAYAQVLDAHHVCADGVTYEADDILLATGARPALVPFKGHDLQNVLTSDTLLSLGKIPSSLLILGGGVIGVEMATAFSALKTNVTIVEAMDRLLPQMDKELGQSVQMNLRKAGVKVITGTRLETVVQQADDMLLSTLSDGQEIAAQYVLLSIGRVPNTDGLFADGFSLSQERGRIVVDEAFQTSVPHVYAIGDVSSKVQLAHVASAQGKYVADALMGATSEVDLSIIPACVYCHPEVASVGITEQEAKETGVDIVTAKFLMGGNGRTLINGGERGFIKLVMDKKASTLLGAHLLCDRATDMIDELSLCIANRLTVRQALQNMRPHPTYIEGVMEALEALEGLCVHQPPVRK